MKIQGSQFLSIEELQNKYLKQGKAMDSPQPLTKEGLSFQDILNEKSGQTEEGVKFSKHASSRLADRNIHLTDGQIKRLGEGTQKAGERGIKESLVLVDHLAFIVNIPNNTVVTAMNQTETDNNVFTNIDGAVIV